MVQGKRIKNISQEGFLKKCWREHKFLSLLIIFIIITLVIIGGFQTFNYIKFLLGYDLTIRLGVDKNDILLINGQNETIFFSIDRISRIFCNTQCEYEFSDLSGDELLSQGNFYLNSPITQKISQEITAPNFGEGQKIYSFDLTCKNHANIVCKTEGKNVTRRTIITLEYSLSPEQLELKQEAGNRLKEEYITFIQLNQTFNAISYQLSNLTFLIEKNSSKILVDSLNNFDDGFSENLLPWTGQEYSYVLEQNSVNISLDQIKNNFEGFSEDLSINLLRYNLMIENLSLIKQNLEVLKNIDLNQALAEKLNFLISTFNKNISEFETENKLSKKQIIVNSLYDLNLSEFINQTNETYRANETIIFNLEKVNISLELINTSINFTLPETKKMCCLENNCNFCKIQEQYPIILVHGHNFNKDISADNSINIFDELQNKLESSGYLDAGELYLYEATRASSGRLGSINQPIVVRASYYFDFMKKPEGYQSVQIKSENIDTYSIRLKEIIEDVKYETQSPKVIIIAHSMGGLVARRYVQIFGNESVDKLILINTPNEGITGKTRQYCSTFGAASECEDMNSESLFINKLNNEKTDTVRITNIVSEGCPMDLGDGDGVVLKENAILNVSNVQNLFIRGSCSGVEVLHNNVLDIKKYPQLFKIINESLKSTI